MCIIPFFATLLLISWKQEVVFAQTGELTCFYQYILYENYCYRYYSKPLSSYEQAVKTCRSEGADLVSIHNVFENGYLTTFNQKGFLIGLQFDPKTEIYSWSDGTSVDYTNYADNFIIGRDYFGYCAKNVEGVWYNAECDVDYLEFVCKKKAAEINSTSNSKCPNTDNIYYAPGMIVSPGYPAEYDLDALSGATGCYYKIAGKNYHKLVIKFEEMLLAESAGSIIVYKDLEPEQTFEIAQADNRFAGGELIVDANLALLHLSGSTKGSFKITTSSVTAGDPLIITPADACPYPNVIYTDLTSISSPGYPAMYHFEIDVMKEGCRYKLAANKGQHIKITFDEIYMEDDTGSVDVYRQWNETEKNKVMAFTDRHSKTSFFVDSDTVLIRVRNTPRGRYLISWSGIPAENCESGWKYFNGSCYYVDKTTKRKYGDAKASCEARNSHLAYIQTEEEGKFVTAKDENGETFFGDYAWFGLYDDNSWHWLDGSILEWSNWYTGQPNYSAGKAPYGGYFWNIYEDKWFCCGIDIGAAFPLCEHETKDVKL